MMNDVIARYREAALVVRRDELAALIVRGPDRVRWLNGMVSNDVAKASPGRGVSALAVERKGKIMAEIAVLARGEELVLLVHRDVRAALLTHFDHHLIMDDAEVAALDGIVVHQVVGLRASERLDALRAAGVGEAHALLTTTAGDDGLFLASAPLPDAIAGDGPEAEAIRVARGLPRFRVDYTEAHYPQEALLEKTHVAFDKGCYVGQEVVCMLELRGHVKRKLVVVAFEGAAEPGAPITTTEGVAVGELAGGAEHALEPGKRLAFALVKVSASAPGTALRVGAIDAAVVVPPLAGGAA
jgi:folate-binding protein YgfZ